MAPDSPWSALLRPGWSDRFFCRSPLPPFHSRTLTFSCENAWWLCELSRLIYRQDRAEIGSDAPAPPRSAFLERVGLRELFTSRNGTNFCAVAASEATFHDPFAALIFRGTSGFEGWLSNLNAVQTPWPCGGAVHCGFRDDFLGIWNKTAAFLDTLDLPLFYAGHSLGGALAMLAASVRPPLAVYAFGAPRPGDAAFAHALRHLPVFRVEHAKDVIPTVPPSVIPFHFDHPGTQILLEPVPAPARDVCPSRRFSDPPEFLFRHAPVNYTAMIETLLDT